MRLGKKRVLVTMVTLTLVCTTGTTAHAGVVPWLWNVFFGPANAPLFPRAAARRGAWYPPAYRGAYRAAPAYYGGYTTSYAPGGFLCGTPVCSNVCGYSDPVIGSSYLANSYVTPFEYSVSNGCGTISYPIQGTVMDNGGYIGSGSVIESGLPVYDPPQEKKDEEEGTTPRPPGGEGMSPTKDDDPDPDGYKFETPIDRSGRGLGDDPGEMFETNKPVVPAETEEGADAPASKAPEEPQAKRVDRQVLATASLTDALGRDTQLGRSRVFTSALRSKKTRRSLRWISVPNDGKTALR